MMETSEIDTVGEYSWASLVFDRGFVLTLRRVETSEHQLRDFLSLESDGTSVRLDETPSSV